MSEEQTRLVLNLEKRFSETPALKTLLTSGKVSINKLSRIVSIAKPENEIFLANQVQFLSKSAVETLVRDEKFVMKNLGEKSDKKSNINFSDSPSQNGLQESFFGSKSLPGQEQNDMKITKSNYEKTTLNLSTEVHQKLLELQQKGIDINELLKEFLQKRDQEIAQKKEEISREILKKEVGIKESLSGAMTNEIIKSKLEINMEEGSGKPQKAISRHIPISIKRILYAEHGTKCSIKTCQKSSTQIHHIHGFPQYKATIRATSHLFAKTITNSHTTRTTTTSKYEKWHVDNYHFQLRSHQLRQCMPRNPEKSLPVRVQNWFPPPTQTLGKFGKSQAE